jgi:hypothetical protein
MEKIEPAAQAYNAYLKQVQQGKQAQYAYQRLKEWGYIKVIADHVILWPSSAFSPFGNPRRCAKHASGFQRAAALI